MPISEKDSLSTDYSEKLVGRTHCSKRSTLDQDEPFHTLTSSDARCILRGGAGTTPVSKARLFQKAADGKTSYRYLA